MSDPDTVSVTPVLQDVARRRADLYQAIIALEQAAARPASGRETAWTEAVLEAVENLRLEVVEHIESTEHADGLYSEIAEHAPRLIHRIGQLREEHVRMRHDVTALRSALQAAPPTDTHTVGETRDDVQRLLGLLVKHRQHGADLVWEAFTLDIGNTG